MASTNKYIPEELRYQVLLNLPVKSLSRFKCVCKSWNKLISSKSFCYSHLAHNKSSSNTKRYLLFDDEDYYSAYLINTGGSCVDVKTNHHRGCSSYSLKLSDTGLVQYGSCCLNVYGICNGLLCLSDGELRARSTIYLWNPIAKSGKKIPNQFEADPSTDPLALAFGFHNDDYKVIRMTRYTHSYYVDIYSLSTNDWKFSRFIDRDFICRGDYMKYPNAMVLNGVAYFPIQEPYQVVCYDMSCEIVRTINFPQHLKANSSYTMKAHEESIGLLEYHKSGILAGMVMWILSGNHTWEKRFVIDLKDNYPLGFIDDSEVIIRSYNSYKFWLFNLESYQFKELKIQQRFETLEEWDTIWGIDSFVESLVLPNKSTMDADFVKERCSANSMAFRLRKWKT